MTVLRLLPVPPLDPPYDDEREPNVTTDGSLALAFSPVTDTMPLRLVPPALPPQRTDDGAPPSARDWSARLTQAIVEVFVGARPAAQLSQFTTLNVLHQLERWTGRFNNRLGAPTQRPKVESVHVSEPRPGIAEICATVDTGPRRRAFAIRLEARGSRWLCVALEIG
ncbi:MAG TPA: Rv3235 family protein [Mycobacterium sp.]|nr:Rv3235 family protein [Mycobacterium sp.]